MKIKIAGVIIVLAVIGSFGLATRARPVNPPKQAPAPSSDQPSRSVWDGVYTTEQAKRGAAIADRECSTCHGATLTSGDEGPPLAGDGFLSEWDGQNVGGLFERMSKTMPQTDPGKLTGQEYVDVLADVLSLNKFPAGKTELANSPDALKQIRIEATKPKEKQDPAQNSKN